ncbi:MAG: LemA family protein [Candidatus Sericytochromatia bacterium]|nr:LemA family protein [Candidatus Tanganyikabacteria bacterium]
MDLQQWLLPGLAIILALFAIATFNSLVALRNQVKNAWHQIDIQLKRRHDLIPNLVDTVKGFMEYERETLDRVIQARAAALDAKGVKATAAAENALSRSLGNLLAVVENYPDLKSNQNVLQLQEELTSTENRVAFARQFYNDLVMKFNTAQQSFPANLVAGALGFQEAEHFEVDSAALQTAPRVDLSLK